MRLIQTATTESPHLSIQAIFFSSDLRTSLSKDINFCNYPVIEIALLGRHTCDSQCSIDSSSVDLIGQKTIERLQFDSAKDTEERFRIIYLLKNSRRKI